MHLPPRPVLSFQMLIKRRYWQFDGYSNRNNKTKALSENTQCLFLYVRPKCANGIKHIELYTELCNLSKYYYATKKGLTKQNYTKYTKKTMDA